MVGQVNGGGYSGGYGGGGGVSGGNAGGAPSGQDGGKKTDSLQGKPKTKTIEHVTKSVASLGQPAPVNQPAAVMVQVPTPESHLPEIVASADPMFRPVAPISGPSTVSQLSKLAARASLGG